MAKWKVTTGNGEWVCVEASRIKLYDGYVVMRTEDGGVRGVFYRPMAVNRVEGDA